ncbi:hypothetical protein [Almyronema epifaneia]|uniref:Uncharacterized protein n=1 Tax=Almyronema epifaneia S1 TaxID=2991925 RepID=A0ABW6ICP5_9CYAN
MASSLKSSVFKLHSSSLSGAVAAIVLFVASCSGNQLNQCKEILEINRKAALVTDTAKTGNREELMNIAKGLDQLATELESLEVNNEKIQVYQNSFVKSYRDIGQALRGIVAAIDDPNSQAITSAVQALDKSTSHNEVLLQEVRALCP